MEEEREGEHSSRTRACDQLRRATGHTREPAAPPRGRGDARPPWQPARPCRMARGAAIHAASAWPAKRPKWQPKNRHPGVAGADLGWRWRPENRENRPGVDGGSRATRSWRWRTRSCRPKSALFRARERNSRGGRLPPPPLRSLGAATAARRASSTSVSRRGAPRRAAEAAHRRGASCFGSDNRRRWRQTFAAMPAFSGRRSIGALI